MKTPLLINSLIGICCLATVTALVAQRQQIAQLQAQEKSIRTEVKTARLSTPGTTTLQEHAPGEAPLTVEETRELMKLRNEVTRLRQRKKELEAVRAENEKLRAQLTTASTNLAPSQVRMPPGYILRRDAQFQGFQTPEATLQSFFWALANRDINVLAQAMGGDAYREIMAEIQRDGEEAVWKGAGSLPGFVVTKSESRSDYEKELLLELMPGEEFRVLTRKEGQQWKLFDFGPAPK